MKETLTDKILKAHLVSGTPTAGEEVTVRIDQTLTQDATGTMVYLQYESMEIPRVKTELSVSYVDHNTLQSGFMNMDDHLFLQSAAAKYGQIRFVVLPTRKRNLSPGSSGAFRHSRKNAFRFGFAYADRRRFGNDCHRRRRSGCGVRDGGRSFPTDLSAGHRRSVDGRTAADVFRQRHHSVSFEIRNR